MVVKGVVKGVQSEAQYAALMRLPLRGKPHGRQFLLSWFPRPPTPGSSGCSCPSGRTQRCGPHLPLLSRHCTHTTTELALEAGELQSFPLLLVCFAY